MEKKISWQSWRAAGAAITRRLSNCMRFIHGFKPFIIRLGAFGELALQLVRCHATEVAGKDSLIDVVPASEPGSNV
ncbi:hypothetical protein ACFODZ_00685 [Marinicella sediminis]|uniref:Uncharacterized protein n=1 Tax=Marinicella sediminis TaxID=1792834 RepID=A0ABV7J6L6_9GAMM|nr:hypothetical protein [Marinicella sediminis]